MKNYNYLVLIGLCLVLAQGSDVSAMPTRVRFDWQEYRKKNGDVLLVEKFAQGFNIAERAHKKLLHAAINPNSELIFGFESDPGSGGRWYPSNVLRAAKDIAEITQGEDSRAYGILERMLSYK